MWGNKYKIIVSLKGDLLMKTKDLILCSLFTAITVIMSQLSIPLIGGVPMTLQTFSISLCGIILGAKRGFVSSLTYVFLGAIGLPVFSQFSGGLQAVVGPTGGFIISFPVMAYVIGYISEKTNNKYFIFLGMLLGATINFVFGTLQFSLITNSNLIQAFSACVVPFIPTTILKAILATFMGLRIKKASILVLSM
jgi:biotin transport system substrate-specific component